ncbi:MAG: DUF2760 domain-containing protein [Planctomycetota bacterium]|nr:DUF2760 domain-containing protein [Planctomycetota bacterium]
MHLLIALKAFFLVLFNGRLSSQVNDVLVHRSEPAGLPTAVPSQSDETPTVSSFAEKTLPAKGSSGHKPAVAKPVKPARSEALTLLAALQREGRLLDFLKEPLTDYSDAQIGAVARDLHRDCGKLVERMFNVQPLLTEAEGAAIEVPVGFDAARYRLVGNVGATPPLKGALIHHGWQATVCELPVWNGSDAAAKVVAPAEVEVK